MLVVPWYCDVYANGRLFMCVWVVWLLDTFFLRSIIFVLLSKNFRVFLFIAPCFILVYFPHYEPRSIITVFNFIVNILGLFLKLILFLIVLTVFTTYYNFYIIYYHFLLNIWGGA